MHFTLEVQDVPTSLVSTASLQNLERNMNSVHEKLTLKEKEVMEYVIEK